MSSLGAHVQHTEPAPTGWFGRHHDAVLATALLLALVTRLPRSWTPLGDNALLEMWTRAVGTHATPLVGGDSRFGWNHLGPWVFYVLAIPYRLLGSRAVGLLVGAGLINAVSVLMISRLVRVTAGRLASAIVVTGSMVFVLTARGNRLVDPWNPYVVQLPFLLALVSCWAVLNHEWAGLPWFLAAGTLCVQSHIAFAPPVVVMSVLVAATAYRSRSSLSSKVLRQSSAVIVLGWLPALIDGVLPHRHNLLHVARFFVQPSARTNGIRAGINVVLRETGAGASWLGGRLGIRLFTEGFDGGIGVLPGIGLVFLTIAGVVACRRRDRVACSLVAVVAVLVAVGAVEMAQGRGELYPYLFGWVTLVGMMTWVAPIVTLARLSDGPRLARLADAAVISTSFVVAGIGWLLTSPRSPRERPIDAAIVAALVRQVEPRLDSGVTYRLDHGSDQFSSIYEHGIVNALTKAGFRIVVGPKDVVLFGRHMVSTHVADFPGLAVEAPYEQTPTGATRIAVSDPLTNDERNEEAQLVASLRHAYLDAGSIVASDIVTTAEGERVLIAGLVHPDPGLDSQLHRLAALRSRGRSIAVIETPPPPGP